MVYVLNQKQELLTFDPRLLPGNPFKKVATISDACIGEAAVGRQVLTMSVDRTGVIWIYARTSNGLVLLTVDSANGFACSKRSLSSNLSIIAMAFAADGVGGATESLFVKYYGSGPQRLGSLELGGDPITVKDRAAVDENVASLTGTGDGKLWAYDSKAKLVFSMDPQTGKGVPGGSISQAQVMTNRIDPPFAFFGGSIYVFPDSTGDAQKLNDVWQVDLTTKAASKVFNLPEADIIGAGVSACAPIDIN